MNQTMDDNCTYSIGLVHINKIEALNKVLTLCQLIKGNP